MLCQKEHYLKWGTHAKEANEKWDDRRAERAESIRLKDIGPAMIEPY